MTYPIVAKPVHLTSPDNGHVKAVLRLRKQRHRRSEQLLIAEGVRQVTRALEAGLRLRELYWCSQWIGEVPSEIGVSVEPSALANDSSTALGFTVTPQLMAKMTYRENPEAVLGVFEQPHWQLENDMTGHDSNLFKWPNDLWLVAVNIQKPGNLGSMVRSAEAAGCCGVLVADGVVDAFNPNAIHASTGAVFRLPVVSSSSQEVIAFLQRRQVGVVAAVPEAPILYTDVNLTHSVALVVGSEDAGLCEAWRSFTATDSQLPTSSCGLPKRSIDDSHIDRKDCQVSIAMLGQTVDSLNAATAAAVLLFEAVRQRRAQGPSGSAGR